MFIEREESKTPSTSYNSLSAFAEADGTIQLAILLLSQGDFYLSYISNWKNTFLKLAYFALNSLDFSKSP